MYVESGERLTVCNLVFVQRDRGGRTKFPETRLAFVSPRRKLGPEAQTFIWQILNIPFGWCLFGLIFKWPERLSTSSGLGEMRREWGGWAVLYIYLIYNGALSELSSETDN